MKLGLHIVIFLLLYLGFLILFVRMGLLRTLSGLMRRGREGMDEAARKRLLKNRRQLITLQKENSFWYRLEQELNYTGLKRWFPYLTAELWFAGNILSGAFLFLFVLLVAGWQKAFIILAGYFVTEFLFLNFLKLYAFRKVNSNLVKFLDFLGNYSVTAGEVTGIFEQISKYMDEPLQTVLEECSYEAKTTGDTTLALLVMAEKIEHPKFKEIVRNMEVSVRYCADFEALVHSSRKNLREYLRMCEERKGVIREAFINMLLLITMSAFTMFVVDGLIETSIWVILWKTWPGRIGLGCVAGILLLFAAKVYRIEK